MIELLSNLVSTLLAIINELGYIGIFIGMTIESSFFPFPSEIILIPAGALAAKGQMSIPLIIIAGLAGSMLGAYINYFLALFLGRTIIEGLICKYGKFVLITEKSLKKSDAYFKKHGEITTFVGRLIVGIRQLISLPAGFSKMNLFKFSIFTALGAGIWTILLTYIGYFFGSSIDSQTKWTISLILLAIALIFTIIYLLIKKKKSNSK